MKKSKLYIFISLIVLFIINTILVVTNKYVSFDNTIHNIVIKLHSEVTTKVMKAFTFCGSTSFIVGVAVGLFIIYLIKKRKEYAFSTVGVLIISTIINNVIKLIIRRPRPAYMTVIENTFSYPSGHMMASTTLYGFFIYLLIKSHYSKKYKIIYSIVLGLLILCVGISRIYLGAHYFSDIFGGALMSLAILVFFSMINDKKKWL